MFTNKQQSRINYKLLQRHINCTLVHKIYFQRNELKWDNFLNKYHSLQDEQYIKHVHYYNIKEST